MVAIWVQLLAQRQIDSKLYAPGSWVNVGEPAALRWIAERQAVARGTDRVQVPEGCGVLALAEAGGIKGWLARYGVTCAVDLGPLGIPYPRTLLWDGSLKVRVDLLPAGFGFLERFEAAVPLYDHKTLADEVGSPADRERTRAIVGDLRVPLYRPGCLFLRQSEGAHALLRAWQEERGGDERLALLRAVFRVKPLLLALPASWIE